jgi:hypothetical protein
MFNSTNGILDYLVFYLGDFGAGLIPYCFPLVLFLKIDDTIALYNCAQVDLYF